MPHVTVIIATYNWSTVLPYSIASALDQSFGDFEVLVVGDGCTDDSEQVVASVADRRVHWHNLETNTGHQWGPNNEGIRRARGDVIAYLGHDDLWLPRHLETLVAAIDDGARLAHTTALMVSPSGRPALLPAAGWVYEPGAGIPPTAMAHDRALVDAAGGWRPLRDTGLLEPDRDLWQRMAAMGHAPRWVPRLTCVKPPASQRRGVYQVRPNHEQAYWLARIRESTDPETSLAATCDEDRLLTSQRARDAVSKVEQRYKQLLRVMGPRLRVRTRLRSIGVLPPAKPPEPPTVEPPPTAEQRWLATRRYKGIED
jgi:glycosyltransferase involved in cell wall biosynthesis